MPTVTRFQNRAGLSPAGRGGEISLGTAMAPGEALRRAGDKLIAQGERQLVEERRDQALAEAAKDKADGIEATSRMAEIRLDYGRRLIEQEEAAAAGAEGFTDAVLDDFDTFAKERLALASDGAQEFLRPRLDTYRANVGVAAIKFEASSRAEKRSADVGATIDVGVNAVRTDPSQFESALADARISIGLAELPAPEEAALLAEADSDYAAAFIRGLNEQDAERAAGILASEELDALLTPRAKDALVNENQVELRRLEAERERDAAARLTRIEGDVERRLIDELAAIEETGAGAGLVTAEEVEAAFPEEAERILAELQKAHDFYTVKTELALASPEREIELLAGLKPEGEGFAAEVERRDLFIQAMQQKEKALEEDPVAYAMFASPRLRAGFENEAELPGALAELDRVMARLGVDPAHRGVLTNKQAESLVASIEGAGGEDAADKMDALAEQYGTRDFGRLMRDLADAGLPGEYQVLATMDDARARQVMGEAIDTGRDALTEAIGAKKATAIDEAIRAELEGLLATFVGVPGGVRVYGYVQDATRILAYRYAQSMTPAEAAQRAAAKAVLERYDLMNGPEWSARAPAGLGHSAANHAGQVLGRMTGADLQIPSGREAAALTIPQAREVMLSAARDGHWITNPNDDGWRLLYGAGLDGQPVLRADGSPVGFLFSEIDTRVPQVSTGLGRARQVR